MKHRDLASKNMASQCAQPSEATASFRLRIGQKFQRSSQCEESVDLTWLLLKPFRNIQKHSDKSKNPAWPFSPFTAAAFPSCLVSLVPFNDLRLGGVH